MNIIKIILPMLFVILILNTFFIFPNFYIKLVRNKWSNLSLRMILISVFLIIQFTFYFTTLIANNEWENWKNWIFPEICTMLDWMIIVILIFPNKLLVECLAPIGIVAGIVNVFLGGIVLSSLIKFNTFRYWQFYFGHAIMLCTYFFIYYIGFTDAKIGKTMMKKLITFITIFVLSVEVWNLGTGCNYIISDFVYAFLDDKSQLYQFIFICSWVLPIFLSIGCLITWLCPPVYNINSNNKLRKTWFEKLCFKLKK